MEARSMRLPRMTTRRWMILVAIVAVVIAAEQMRERRAAYLRLWYMHVALELKMNDQIREAVNTGSYYFGPIESKAMIDRFTAFAAYHSSLRRKYEYAAAYPWVKVPPDPPRP